MMIPKSIYWSAVVASSFSIDVILMHAELFPEV